MRGVLAQRLLRRAGGGRILVAEWLPMSRPLRRAILARSDGEALAEAAGHVSLREEAAVLVERGVVTKEEVDRVLGSR